MASSTMELDGERRRDLGIAATEVAALFDPWVSSCDRAITYLASCGLPFSAEDVRELCGDPPRPNLFGVRFRAALRAGSIRRVGYAPSTRPERRGGVVAMWEGVWNEEG